MPTVARILSPDHVAVLRAHRVPPEAITVAGTSVANAAACKWQPAKSLYATLRHLAAFGVPDEIRSRIEEIARDLLPQSPPTDLGREPVGIHVAAALLGCSERTLRKRLHDVTWRHFYGWPEWDGYRRNFKPQALDPRTRDAFMGTLPGQEPRHIAASPPQQCRLGVQVEMRADALEK